METFSRHNKFNKRTLSNDEHIVNVLFNMIVVNGQTETPVSLPRMLAANSNIEIDNFN